MLSTFPSPPHPPHPTTASTPSHANTQKYSLCPGSSVYHADADWVAAGGIQLSVRVEGLAMLTYSMATGRGRRRLAGDVLLVGVEWWV